MEMERKMLQKPIMRFTIQIGSQGGENPFENKTIFTFHFPPTNKTLTNEMIFIQQTVWSSRKRKCGSGSSLWGDKPLLPCHLL